MASSPVSSLSSFSSGDFDHAQPALDSDGVVGGSSDSDFPRQDEATQRASKRRRITKTAPAVQPYDSPELIPAIDTAGDWTDASSDTTGSVPGSPRTLKELAMPDEETLGTEQVRVCSWDGCDVGDLGNVDELVAHLNDEHVGIAKKTKFTCEWSDCKAKGKTQMSAYALKAHLRSHTKEKPFYCMLPECDRSFTRSDALAKHMRTVHETESLRTIEHYGRYGHITIPTNGADASPRGTTPQPPTLAVLTTATAPTKPPARLKLVLSGNKISSPSHSQNNNHESESEATAPTSPLSPNTRDALFGVLPPDLEFPEDEVLLPRNDLFQLLRRQIYWANQESAKLLDEANEMERERRYEWMRKELLLENTLEAEFARSDRRGIIDDVGERGTDAGMPNDVVSAQGPAAMEHQNRLRKNEGIRIVASMSEDASVASKLPLSGQKMPWYRDPQWKRAIEAKAKMLENVKSSAAGDWASDGPSRIEIDDDGEVGGDDTEVEDDG